MDGIMQNTWFSKSSHQKLHRATDGAGVRDIPAEIKHRNAVAAWQRSLKCIAHIHCILCAFVCMSPPDTSNCGPVCHQCASLGELHLVKNASCFPYGKSFWIWKRLPSLNLEVGCHFETKWSPRLRCLMSPSLPLLWWFTLLCVCMPACLSVCLLSPSRCLPGPWLNN